MIKSHRRQLNKHRHAAQFKHDVSKTYKKNIMPPMRGGWRL